MISVAEARERILARLRAVGCETVSLELGWRRVLGAPLVARLTQPPAAISAMDGYALRAVDGGAGAVLRVVGEAPAGRPFGGLVGVGAAVRLFTGSVVPAGADCVVMQENVRREGETICLAEAAVLGRHVRLAGEDFAAGDVLLPAGRRLSARDIGLAAAANHPWLTVHRRPRVAIVSTGDEIALPGEAIGAGGIASSNGFALAAIVRAAGGEPVLLPVARDDSDAIADTVDQAAGCDLLLTSGGASVGDHDLVASALAARGLELDFWKIAMRPGKPLMFGAIGGTPMLGLPGNPVSAIVCAALFLRPALAVLGGERPVPSESEPARLTVALPANDARADYLRATLSRAEDGALLATPCRAQASSLIRVLACSDALLMRAPHAPAALAGDRVEVMRLAALGV